MRSKEGVSAVRSADARDFDSVPLYDCVRRLGVVCFRNAYQDSLLTASHSPRMSLYSHVPVKAAPQSVQKQTL